MPIVTSVIDQDAVQRDGRRAIRELHTDHVGVQYPVHYVATSGFNASAALAARVATLEAMLNASEIAANVAQVLAVGSEASPTLIYSTAAQNFAALRVAYQSATRIEAVMVGDYLSARTNAQLQAAFSMTNAEVNALRTNKLTPAASVASTIRAMTGA